MAELCLSYPPSEAPFAASNTPSVALQMLLKSNSWHSSHWQCYAGFQFWWLLAFLLHQGNPSRTIMETEKFLQQQWGEKLSTNVCACPSFLADLLSKITFDCPAHLSLKLFFRGPSYYFISLANFRVLCWSVSNVCMPTLWKADNHWGLLNTGSILFQGL